MNRREFLKKSIYLVFALPLFSLIGKIIKHPKSTSSKIQSKEAMYYNKLAG